MRILVTGSSGLVGRALCRALRDQGDDAVEYALDPIPPGGPAGGAPRLDVLDRASLDRAVRGVDGVVHLAAVSRCAPAEADPERARRVNVDGTENVLRALRDADSTAWFVFASSREVYGEAALVPVAETAPIQPKSVYGRTKAEAERIIQREFVESPRPTAILRLTNLYGSPYDHAERVIPSFVRLALRGEPLEVRGPGQELDFLELRDAVRAILLVAAGAGRSRDSPTVLNIASGEGCTLGELAERVIRVTASASEVRSTNPEAWTPSRFVADISRARESLAWEPRVELGQGLAELAQGFRERGVDGPSGLSNGE